jgi:cytochrome c oxidase accessory protein FixG
VSKQAIFFAIAVLIANTFLSYIIGVEEVLRIVQEPITQNWQGFTAMILFSGAFYFVFSYMREQVCIAVCPYGRLQGVMLDKNSIVIAYDHVRGEPRGKIRKNKKKKPSTAATAQAAATTPESAIDMLPPLGDCIDCKLCVQVCPTGIDIRDGTQLECVNCTACIDACDEVMDKIDRPRGLIRYDSDNGITQGTKKLFTPRVIGYTIVLGILLAVNAFLLTSRTNVEVLILRTPGMLYQEVDDTYLSNLYNYQIINKTKKEFPVELRLANDNGRIRIIGEIPNTKAADVIEGAFFIEMDRNVLEDRSTPLTIEVYSEDKLIDRVKTNFLGPVK